MMASFSLTKKIGSLLLLLAVSSPMTRANDMTKFNWLASESAPHHFPMQIMRGSSFRYHGSETDGLYIPSGGTLYRGWGNSISTHVVGADLKPLPDQLDITFYSYMEDTFYEGTFDLPYERILNLFREGVEADKNNPLYRRVTVGIAPGGSVAVWLTGRKTVEVFFGKAKKTERDWSKAMQYPESKRAEFIKAEVEESVRPDVLAAIHKNGIPFDQWAQFRTKYQWSPTFVTERLPKDNNIRYFNGETEDLHFPLSDSAIKAMKPVPKRLAFNSLIKGRDKLDVFVIMFDQDEMLSAFKKLGCNGEQLHLEFSPTLPKPDTKIRLYNDKESIALTKWVVE
ncbi:MAG: DUF2931 family protein [Chitinophagaceae bacterium]|nr:MAG: DUF2931 family protein [Chitinophagaceae bacterium]